jgi:hypothetical protein
MAIYARGACTITSSLCCCGMSLCRLATGKEPQITTVGSMRGTGLQRCEVYVDILSHPVLPDGIPWSTWAIGANMDDAMEKAAHMALTALCSQNLPATVGMPISLYPIQD